MSDIADITKFFFELGTLKRTERAGWSVTGISKPEVIAAHAYRAVVIGYMLAELEKCDKNKVMRMLMFHDIPETRIGDLHKVAASYLNSEEGEAKAAADQSKLLPSSVVNGYKHSEEFLERIRKVMVTQSAKKLLAEIEKSDGFWWKGLKKNV